MTPLEDMRHSASHVLATALLRLFPDAKLDIGPPTDTGFYYDVDLEHKLTAEDLVRIEAEMKKVADENQPFLRREVSREEAAEIIRSRGQERYKLGRLADIPADEKISFYQNGEFCDPLRGHARALHLEGQGVQAPLDRRRLPPREREEQTAPADLRHGLRDQGRAGEVPGADRWWPATATTASWDVTVKLFVIDEDVGQGLILWTPGTDRSFARSCRPSSARSCASRDTPRSSPPTSAS